jgi:hypothetical protein
MYTYICIYIYIYINLDIHKYICIYIYMCIHMYIPNSIITAELFSLIDFKSFITPSDSILLNSNSVISFLDSIS